MAWTFCTSGAAIAKAGLHANSTIINDVTVMEGWSEQTESFINSKTRRDWITNPPSAATSGALTDVASADIGNKIATYDPTGYLNREFNSIINVNLTKYNEGMTVLKDQPNHKEDM